MQRSRKAWQHTAAFLTALFAFSIWTDRPCFSQDESYAEAAPQKNAKLVVDCTKPLSCSCNKHSYYAYAPSAVQLGLTHHVFFCSEGSDTAWDYIRSSLSRDSGRTWSTPEIKIMARGKKYGNSDFAACDPSIVHYHVPGEPKAYFYLFYGSAQFSKSGKQQGVLQVARSEKIEGLYQTLMQDGSWVDSTWPVGSQPPPGFPRAIVRTHYDVNDYGVGQPTVVCCPGADGKPVLKMWYTDTSNYQSKHAVIFAIESQNPAVWPVPRNWPEPVPAEGLPQYVSPKTVLLADPRTGPVETNAYNGTVDVKFDSQQRRFLMFYQNTNKAGLKQISIKSSTDGINWLDIPNTLHAQFNETFDGPGALSDMHGYLSSTEPQAVFIGEGWNSKKHSPTPAFTAPDPAGLFRINVEAGLEK